MKSEDLIKRHEGRRFIPYKDTVGVLTIGIGRNLEKGISEHIVSELFKEDMVEVRADCLRLPWFHELTPIRQAVIENMIFNLGFSGFMEFKKTIRFIEKGDYDSAALEMLDSKWSRQVGNRATELASMMRFNKWPGM